MPVGDAACSMVTEGTVVIGCEEEGSRACEGWPILGRGPGLLTACYILRLEGSRNSIWNSC